MSNEELAYQSARKRVEAMRGFYIHLTVYVLVNILLFVINMVASPDALWFFWPLGGWGIAVVIHAIKTFVGGNALGREWEERKIQDMMRE